MFSVHCNKNPQHNFSSNFKITRKAKCNKLNMFLLDWKYVPKPHVAWRDLGIYEMHLRGFSNAHGSGTYMDVIYHLSYI